MIDTIAAAQQEEVEREIAGLDAETRAAEKEIEELVGSSPFQKMTRSETLRRRPAARRHSHAARELAGKVPF